MNDFKPLPIKLMFNGFKYNQLFRTQYEAVYQQKLADNKYAYEAIQVKLIPEKTIKNKTILAHEKWPSNKDFGITAWTYNNMDRAIQKFWELYNKRNVINLP